MSSTSAEPALTKGIGALKYGHINIAVQEILGSTDEENRIKKIRNALGIEKNELDEYWEEHSHTYLSHVMELISRREQDGQDLALTADGACEVLAMRIQIIAEWIGNGFQPSSLGVEFDKLLRLNLFAYHSHQGHKGDNSALLEATKAWLKDESALIHTGYKNHSMYAEIGKILAEKTCCQVYIYNTGGLSDAHEENTNRSNQKVVYPFRGEVEVEKIGLYLKNLFEARSEEARKASRLIYGWPLKISSEIKKTYSFTSQTIGNCCYASHSAFLVNYFNESSRNNFHHFTLYECKKLMDESVNQQVDSETKPESPPPPIRYTLGEVSKYFLYDGDEAIPENHLDCLQKYLITYPERNDKKNHPFIPIAEVITKLIYHTNNKVNQENNFNELIINYIEIIHKLSFHERHFLEFYTFYNSVLSHFSLNTAKIFSLLSRLTDDKFIPALAFSQYASNEQPEGVNKTKLKELFVNHFAKLEAFCDSVVSYYKYGEENFTVSDDLKDFLPTKVFKHHINEVGNSDLSKFDAFIDLFKNIERRYSPPK